ncbi:MAG: hypothetical protein WAL50_15870 [Kineosporiaceae bacterium]
MSASAIPVDVEVVERVAQDRVPVGERDAAQPVDRVVLRRRNVQRTEEGAQRGGGVLWIGRGRGRGGHPRQVRQHAPCPGIPLARHPDAHRHGDRQRQPGRDDGQPLLLVLDERRGDRAAWQTDDELVAEAQHDIVPALGERRQRQVSEVGVLRGQQAKDEVVSDLDLGDRHVLRGHSAPVVATAPSERGTT